MRILLAFRVFFQALFNAAAAERIERAIRPDALPAPSPTETSPTEAETAAAETSPRVKPPAKAPRTAARSEALTLLAALQREARFVDLVKEPLSQYEDAQIGAAAREVLRDCAALLERMFALQPLATEEEGNRVEVPHGYHPLQYRLSGNVSGEPPYQGKLVHPGWIATRCELPEWTGDDAAARVVAPQEVELSS